jgi:hypothetical protein
VIAAFAPASRFPTTFGTLHGGRAIAKLHGTSVAAL